MARQIIKQPDGNYAEYSSIVDEFVIWNATKEKIIAHREKDAAEEARRQVEKIFAALEAGEDPYYKMGITWDDALKNHNSRCEKKYRIEPNRWLSRSG